MFDKIPFRWPIFNRQSIIDSEELTALELAGRSAAKTNEIVDWANGLQADIDSKEKSDDITNNRKLSPTGNFTGSWFGYSNPVMSDPGIQNVVNDLLAKTASVGVFAVFFGVSTENDDNHDSIIAAMDFAMENGYSTIYLPAGEIKTAPISFQGYHNLTIVGTASNYYTDFTDQSGTTIKIISEGSVGLQFADTVNPYVGYSGSNTTVSPWTARSCKVINIKLNCNSMVTRGINGNFDFTLENVAVINAIEDGVVLEDFTYPANFYRVFSAHNGRHGIYCRGKNTTVYNMTNCECSSNDGYGLCIEGGADCHFLNMVFQSNKTGAVKIRNTTSEYGSTSFLGSLLFTNIYTEDNGRWLNTDPQYEGNYQIVITSSTINDDLANKAHNIVFRNGAINFGANQKEFKIDNVFGLTLDNVSVALTQVDIPTPQYCASLFVSPGANFVDSGAVAPYPFIASYGKNSENSEPFLIYKGGVIGKRGRVQRLQFYLDSITAGSTVLMKPIHLFANSELPKGYPLFNNASVLAVSIMSRGSAGRAGTLTAHFQYSFSDSYGTPGSDLFIVTDTVLDISAHSYVKREFEPLAAQLSASMIVGFELTASADYLTDSGSDKSILVEMLIES